MVHATEILAPAGNMDMLHAAVLAGADAVYLGLENFNARRTAGNFTIDALGQAVVFCHARQVRVYVTLNTTVYPAELPILAQMLCDVAQTGADAVIVQDLAAARLVQTIAPDIALHASTQMSVHSLEGALQLADIGFSRVILSRELSLPEIAHIAKHCGIETEVFVHGALCMSASGQCYMSAFLGGRSGNRGGCAGPCRLPFEADAPVVAQHHPDEPALHAAENAHHLSLKDMSHIERLPQLVQAGVSSVKIEGRLRTAEYAAAAVNACRQTLDGGVYDATLLEDVFSRSGFTAGYLDATLDATMFGVRTEENATAARAAAPQLRELFRRERPRVPVTVQASIEADGAKLAISDESGNCALAYSGETQPQPAQKNQTENIQKALAKMGGTPFYALQPAHVNDGAWFLPASEWNEMRRKALDSLLAKRSKLMPHVCLSEQAPEVQALLRKSAGTSEKKASKDARTSGENPQVYVQMESLTQMPHAWAEMAKASDAQASDDEWQGNGVPLGVPALPQGIIVPIEQWRDVPPALRNRTWLALPRWMAALGVEDAVQCLVQESAHGASGDAFAGYFVQNLAHIRLCKGLPMFAGFGMNITNALSAHSYAAMGLVAMTLSPELLATDMTKIVPVEGQHCVLSAAIAYGHLPLMLTRACPLQNTRSCKGCSHEGLLLDRKGKYFPVRCSAPATAGIRTIYNPIALYMGDKLRELPVDIALVQFTVESPQDVVRVLICLQNKLPYAGEFTRGLYFKGTN